MFRFCDKDERAWPPALERQQGLLSTTGQQAVCNASAAVIGCGGLGGMAAELLVRAGVGRLVLVDPDRFEPSNLNRQIGATAPSLGRAKATALGERLAAINPELCLEADQRPFTPSWRPPFGLDLVLDCLDDPAAKKALGRWCLQRGLPLVHGAVHGFAGQVAVQAARPVLDRLYPPRGDGASRRRPHAPVPAIGSTVAVVAGLMVGEAVLLLTGHPSPLTDAVLFLDLRHQEWIRQACAGPNPECAGQPPPATRPRPG